MLRRNGPVVKSVESVLSLEGSLWRERFVEEICENMTSSTKPEVHNVVRWGSSHAEHVGLQKISWNLDM